MISQIWTWMKNIAIFLFFCETAWKQCGTCTRFSLTDTNICPLCQQTSHRLQEIPLLRLKKRIKSRDVVLHIAPYEYISFALFSLALEEWTGCYWSPAAHLHVYRLLKTEEEIMGYVHLIQELERDIDSPCDFLSVLDFYHARYLEGGYCS